jgi:hypothetical protein
MATIVGDSYEGCTDNIVSVMCLGRILGEVDAIIELTNDEEMHMDGARYVAREHSPEDTLMIVMDVCTQPKKKINFSIENVVGVNFGHIKKSLKGIKCKYVYRPMGEESEAYLYRDMGFAVIEIDIPVTGGYHNLDSQARVEDIKIVSEVIKALVNYFKDKDRSQISDNYRVDAPQ